MTEVEKLVERLNEGAQRVLDYCFRGNPAARGLVTIPRHPDDIDALLMEAARRVEELEGALRELADAVEHAWPSLSNLGPLRAARSALSEGSGSSRELAPPDESGDACGATERADG